MKKNKHLHLLLIMLFMLVLLPFVDKFMSAEVSLISFVFLAGLVVTMRALDLPKKIYLICVAAALLIFVLEAALKLMPLCAYKPDITLVTWSMYAVFILVCIVIMVRKLFKSEKVTTDTIVGGINIYFLFAFFWTILYHIINMLDPDTFNIKGRVDITRILYFSYNTLTTLGNGDIVPVNRFAMILSSLEAITGQLYLAIFVAILVGLHISHRMSGGGHKPEVF